jgi:hypothetical protein
MSIGTAIPSGASVVVYDTCGHKLFTELGQLVGYTPEVVTITHGSVAVMYDAAGRKLASIPIPRR